MAESLLDQLLPRCEIVVDRTTHGPRVPLDRRLGVMIHFDDSSNDASGVSWFRDPAFKLSYNRAYLDDGRRCRITPSMHDTAWHAGICLREHGLPVGTLSNGFLYGGANTGYFGLAFTADANDHITSDQLDAMVTDIAMIFRLAHWLPESVDHRIVGHDAKAIFNPRDNPNAPNSWGKLGRKIDPTGARVSDPVVDMDELRQSVRTYLEDPTAVIWRNWPQHESTPAAVSRRGGA